MGAMTTMYASVAHRTAEIGTLRALGFQRPAILRAFLTESLCLALFGGALGLALASTLGAITVSTMNWQTFSELAFRFTMTFEIVAKALFRAGHGPSRRIPAGAPSGSPRHRRGPARVLSKSGPGPPVDTTPPGDAPPHRGRQSGRGFVGNAAV